MFNVRWIDLMVLAFSGFLLYQGVKLVFALQPLIERIQP